LGRHNADAGQGASGKQLLEQASAQATSQALAAAGQLLGTRRFLLAAGRQFRRARRLLLGAGGLADPWLARRQDLAVRTTELYRYLLDDHIMPTLGDMPLGSVAPSMVAAWHAKLASEHRTTAAKAYRLLSQIMRAAVADRMLGLSPCQVRGAATEHSPERPVASVAEVGAPRAAH
jgi:hypothetical protein